ncbi:hypothetical protein ACNR9V_03190 [Parageobacillus thermoglucosidasius]|uniref:hypothetical protein n=1 Tax=Parageobacillus thermoglucosidasius TaxID=1426 RepID=UPI003B683317
MRPGKQEFHGIKPTPQTPRPPKPPSQNSKPMCEHKYKPLHLDMEQFSYLDATVLEMNVIFYCEKCLEIKSVDKTVELKRNGKVSD